MVYGLIDIKAYERGRRLHGHTRGCSALIALSGSMTDWAGACQLLHMDFPLSVFTKIRQRRDRYTKQPFVVCIGHPKCLFIGFGIKKRKE